MGGAIINSVGRALQDAGQDDYVWAMITWTVGDMTWPGNNTNVPGSGSVPESINAKKPASLTVDKLAFNPGETSTSRFAKLAAWIKTLNT